MNTFLQQKKSRPMTAAERQAICRAKKKGTYQSGGLELGGIPSHLKPGTLEFHEAENAMRIAHGYPALPLPPYLANQQALPDSSSKTTAIQKALPNSTEKTVALALPGVDPVADQILSSLPPAVAKRLKTLVSKHQSCKQLTADELAEARGLLDIAEYFSIQRMRKALAA